MIKTKVFSFSTKSGEDETYITKLKKQANAKGVSFSWLVVTAVKQYVESLDENNRP